MELYGARVSPFYERVLLQVKLKNLTDKIACPGVPGGDLKSPEYLAINPLGKIPCLKDGDFVLPESSVIAEYLEEKFPETPMLPESAEDRAKVRMVVKMLDANVLPPLITIFRQMKLKEKDKDLIAVAIEDIAKGLDGFEHFIDPAPFVVGSNWSLGDCALLPVMFYLTRFLPLFGTFPLEGRPNLERWHLAVQDKPVAVESEAEMQKALEAFRKANA